MFGIVAKLIFFIAFALSAQSYIPAVSTNDTQKALAGGLNVTDVSKLNVHWYSKGLVCAFSFISTEEANTHLVDHIQRMCLLS